MTLITIDKNAGDTDLSVLDLDFKAFLNQGFKDHFDYFADGKGVQHVTLYQKDGDFLQLTGAFKISAFGNRDRSTAIKSLDTLTVGFDGQAAYSMSDVDITSKDLRNDKTLAAFADAQAYKIVGNGDDNVLAGGLRGDQLYGNDGNDKLFGASGKDKLYGGNNNDYLSGGNQDDLLSGDVGNDKLDGGDGNDKLDGGAGKNILIGGEGDDVYVLGASDKIIEEKGRDGGHDTVQSLSSVDLSKFANVEDILLLGKANIDAYGNSSDNNISGNDGANVIAGGKGDDELTGRGGADHFVFAKGDGSDTITDFNASGKDHDFIDLDAFGKLKFSQIEVEKHGKDGIDINLGHGDHIYLEHVSLKNLDIHDFQF